ncbi:hypothetical protein MMC07_009012 [Pseudocyphellaria aurata]|nr:hypothetical protein [Pseudocyphellaria aurata]
MTRKKTSSGAAVANRTMADVPASTTNSSIASTLLSNSKLTVPGSKSRNGESSTSALIICRNKHWRYISSFHGPWLQLPPEVLESLAYSNYASPHPRPIDPAVFFDLVKVRRLVEEATDLAVRAANGTTSSTLSNSLNASNGIYGGGGAAALGLGISGGGANAKLSRERKHRMREVATQKLSRAYRLDEIATSVATMQSASSLEDVAKLVLQRSAHDSDAKYVHFFHEKIPSRMLAQCTDLNPLDEIIQDRPTEGAPLRTRAVTKLFKEDFLGAARDLTDSLAICRYKIAQHKSGSTDELQLIDALGGVERKSGVGRDYSYESKLEEEEQPSSLEAQLLFHRAGVYLTLACQNVHASLDSLSHSPKFMHSPAASHKESDPPQTSISKEVLRQRLEARKLVKTNAKRALRDYISFLSHFKYTPGVSVEVESEVRRNVNDAANENSTSKGVPTSRQLEMSGRSSLSCGNLANALVPHKHENPPHESDRTYRDGLLYPAIPAPVVYPVSALFSSTPPPNLPQFPGSLALVPRNTPPRQSSETAINPQWTQKGPHEAVTYHPLLADAIHSLLLCHSLIQTSPKEHLRHAHMAARLVRVCDGYPIFLAARSPSRADWIEVLQQANNWIGLQQSWESLCTPAPLSEPTRLIQKKETEEEVKETLRQEAIMEALADERVHDEVSFQAAVAARERRAEAQRKDDLEPNGSIPRKWVQENLNEYPISTERAETVARWVREAPRTVEGSGKAKKGSKKEKIRNETENATSIGEIS